MAIARPSRPTRQDNRRQALLDAAAQIFKEKGFDGATIRDIASAVDMLPGSVYYHFASKEELFVAVHEEGIRRVTESVSAALEAHADPWDRLQAASAAHLKAILDETDYASVVIRSIPNPENPVWKRLASLRNQYEDILRGLVDSLPLGDSVDRKYFRLSLLGALNWSQIWYQSKGDSPERIASEIVGLVKSGNAAE